jgi:UPF0288 family protein (methanogenesis marker protein 3)
MDPEEEEKKRIIAVKLYLKGEKRTNICKDLNRSKGWLSKWVNRYKTGKEDWYKSHSRAPKNPGKKTKDEIENAVINVRKSLMEIRVNPQQVMFLGLNIDEAKAKAQERGLAIEIDGDSSDQAIIVEQDPKTTMEILKNKKVSVLGIPPDLMLHIKFYYDKAPITIEYLRHALKLKERPVGPLSVFFTYENTTLFKTIKRAEGYKELMPENTPLDKVIAGEMGVTNQASRQYGIIGIKNEDDERYGPTGEKFHSTNIIGRVIDAEKLKSVTQGDIIYIMEVD